MNEYQPPWAADAACRNLPKELFFAAEADTESRARAASACEACPVLQLCRDAALAKTLELAEDDDLDLDFGFWALTTPEDRIAIIMMRRDHELHDEASR